MLRKPLIVAILCAAMVAPSTALADMRGGWLNRTGSSEAQTDPPLAAEMPVGMLQGLIDAAEPWAVVHVPPGIYRETAEIDKPLVLVGEPGAEIRGSDIWIDGWERHGDHWRRHGAPAFDTTGEWCRSSSNGRCNWPHQVFLNGWPLFQVAQNPATGQFAVVDGAVVLADDPNGQLVEVTLRHAWIVTASNNVEIRGFSMRHAADRPHEGALSNAGHANWTVTSNTLLHAHMAVISLRSAGNLTVVGNEIGYGGRMGIHSWQAWDVQITGNLIHTNNTEDFEGGWEAGGMKLSGLADSAVIANEVRDNNGAGIWCDVGCNGMTIADNRVHHNRRYGILYEISRTGTIVDNQIWENGWGFPDWGFGAGFVCQNCRDTEVAGNIVAWNADGISIISQHRDGYTDVVNNHVHNNLIALETDWSQNTYMLAWLEDWHGRLTDSGSNNQGAGNVYYHATPEAAFLPFVWGRDQRFGIDDLAGFNATPGEEHGRFISESDLRTLLDERAVPAAPEPRS